MNVFETTTAHGVRTVVPLAAIAMIEFGTVNATVKLIGGREVTIPKSQAEQIVEQLNSGD